VFDLCRTSLVVRLASLPAGPELAAALDALDTDALVAGEHVDVLVALARQAAHAHARLLQGMAVTAARTAGVGFDSDGVAYALHLTRRGAQNQVALAQDLLIQLPMGRSRSRRRVLDPRPCLLRRPMAASEEAARSMPGRVLPAATEMTAGNYAPICRRKC
jgi:hypothetical protein